MEVTSEITTLLLFFGFACLFKKETTYLRTKHPKNPNPQSSPTTIFSPIIQICNWSQLMKLACICLHYDCNAAQMAQNIWGLDLPAVDVYS